MSDGRYRGLDGGSQRETGTRADWCLEKGGCSSAGGEEQLEKVVTTKLHPFGKKEAKREKAECGGGGGSEG